MTREERKRITDHIIQNEYNVRRRLNNIKGKSGYDQSAVSRYNELMDDFGNMRINKGNLNALPVRDLRKLNNTLEYINDMKTSRALSAKRDYGEWYDIYSKYIIGGGDNTGWEEIKRIVRKIEEIDPTLSGERYRVERELANMELNKDMTADEINKFAIDLLNQLEKRKMEEFFDVDTEWSEYF